MKIQLKPLAEQVMVITGASSGIGLVTARHAARAGARVVLSARNETDLNRAVHEIRRNGGRAIVVHQQHPDNAINVRSGGRMLRQRDRHRRNMPGVFSGVLEA